MAIENDTNILRDPHCPVPFFLFLYLFIHFYIPSLFLSGKILKIGKIIKEEYRTMEDEGNTCEHFSKKFLQNKNRFFHIDLSFFIIEFPQMGFLI